MLGMSIYEIDLRLFSLVDEETGDIKDYEEWKDLVMAREEKIENTGLWIKSLKAEAKAIRQEEKALAERRRAAERKVESLKKYLNWALGGEKFKTSKLDVSYRRSESVNIENEESFIEWAEQNNAELIRYNPEANKTAIKEALKNGEQIPGAILEEKTSIQIK